MPRIIAGDAKRISLKVPQKVSRPTADRVRENLFNLIYDLVQESLVLDLFAGSGALGLESLSRGAKRAVFVEGDRQACRVIQENCVNTRLNAYSQVIQTSAYDFLHKNRETFDLIFADPPYWKEEGHEDHVLKLLTTPKLQESLSDEGYLVIEQFDKAPIHQVEGWKLIEERKYGSCRILLYQIEFI